MASENKTALRPFGMKDKLGYMFGDFGNDFTFILSSLFLMKFYTDVMGVSAGVVGIVMMAARIVDAFTDITMGQIVDRCKPTKDGKFRPWLKRMCGPVAIASFLIFQSGLAGMPYGFKVAWLAVTYILWGSIFYTSINIPYGSMASAVSPESNEIKSFVTNPDDSFTVMYSIEDPYGCEVASAVRPADSTAVTIYVPDAELWSMDEPNLYTVVARLQRNNEAFDEIYANVGVRSYTVTPDGGFSINGEATPLRGVSRHQDKLYKGNALTVEDHYQDAQIIKELGANTIRLAHYQHSQVFYDACDELGFAVWAEIPFISVFKSGKDAHEHCRRELTELIVQNYNHPSIMFWGISNEILIGGISQELVDCHHDLQKLCKELDPTRLTTIAHVSNTPTTGPMHRITDVESYNHYFGWYGGKIEQNGPWLDKFHAENPDICLGISEYGCEGIINWHSNTPQCKDYSEEYQALYHEYMAQAFEDRPWIWASHVWNMFDFGCAARSEGGVKGRNNKGLVTIDRKTRKDSFYVYQAYWAKDPMVHIAGRRHAQRAGETTEVKVYSNQDTVTLYCNGKEVGTQTAHRVFKFNVALDEGFNVLMAVADTVKDSITLEKVDAEPVCYTLPEFNERQEGVANWFKQMGSMDLTAPMPFSGAHVLVWIIFRPVESYPAETVI